MASSVNKVILLGNVGKDPEVRYTPSGAAVANFTLATSEKFKDKEGQWQERTEWHRITAWDKLAEIIGQYVKKGSKLYVEGKIQTRSWDDKQTGEKKYTTEIQAREISLLSGRGEGHGGGGDEYSQEPRRGGGYSRGASAGAGGRQQSNDYDQSGGSHDAYAHGTEISDEDIPF
jgi:single-strand DNA-binding protein